MKRVYTLYRVSTAKQVDVTKDDIPMQKIACHEFADHQRDWEIVKEFEEKGVSGFKGPCQPNCVNIPKEFTNPSHCPRANRAYRG